VGGWLACTLLNGVATAHEKPACWQLACMAIQSLPGCAHGISVAVAPCEGAPLQVACRLLKIIVGPNPG
jgi:hypothetical protein